MSAKKISDKKVVITSLCVSILDVSLNLVVALITRSTVLLSQALQGLSDLITSGILYLGLHRSKRKEDNRFQFGYGREVFFWVLIAGMMMFTGTGFLSLYFGYQQFIDPSPINNPFLGLTVLTIGLLSNGYSLSLSVKRLHRINPEVSFLRQVLGSSIVETKATLLIDFIGSVGAVFGISALSLYIITDNGAFDGLGSMCIGVSMMLVSLLLMRDVHGLIVGRSVDQFVADQIIGATKTVKGVREVLDLRTMYLGSDSLLVIIEVHIDDGLDTDQIEIIVDNIKTVVCSDIPQVRHIQVELETPDHEMLARSLSITK